MKGVRQQPQRSRKKQTRIHGNSHLIQASDWCIGTGCPWSVCLCFLSYIIPHQVSFLSVSVDKAIVTQVELGGTESPCEEFGKPKAPRISKFQRSAEQHCDESQSKSRSDVILGNEACSTLAGIDEALSWFDEYPSSSSIWSILHIWRKELLWVVGGSEQRRHFY